MKTSLALFFSLVTFGIALAAPLQWRSPAGGDCSVYSGVPYAVEALDVPTASWNPSGTVIIYKNGAFFAQGNPMVRRETVDYGPQVVEYRVVGWSGLSSILRVTVLAANQVPYGRLDMEPLATLNRPFTLSGWVVDAEMGAPVSKVSIFLDGISIGDATLGQDRPDIATQLGDSRFTKAGFSLAFSGILNGAPLTPGLHTLTAKAYDNSGGVGALSSVNFEVVANQPPTGCLDTQLAQHDAGETLLLTGWAADKDTGAPVSEVRLVMDGEPAGYGVLGADRPDVAAFFSRPDWQYSGFTLSLPLNRFSTGSHSCHLLITDEYGATFATPSKSFVITDTWPRVSLLTSPLGVLAGYSKISLNANATDATGDMSVIGLDCIPPGASSWNSLSSTSSGVSGWLRALGTGSGTLKLDYLPTIAGEYRFRARASDAAGHQSFSESSVVLAAAITSSSDFDRDGIPDFWEIQFGFKPNDASDALKDADSDGRSNLREYQDGTNPNLARLLQLMQSPLKIDLEVWGLR